MKKVSKVILSMFLALSVSLNLCIPTFASDRMPIETYESSRDDAPQEVKDLVAKLISFYGDEYKPDVIKHLADLKEIFPEYYGIWNSIINYWDWIETKMIENIGVAPDGIQSPEKHAFIVLGFALNDDGTMTDELIGRLEVAKASAEKYPSSYILVTGGVEKNGWTEGRRMRDWLVENGIDEDRIIVEEKAPDTAGNASNSFEILYKDYDVDTVSLITTQYHLKRGSILYYAESLLKAKELGVEPIKFIGEANAGWYRPDKTSEPLSLKAYSLRLIARVPEVNVSDIHTNMQGIEVSGKTEYVQGEDLDITVKSIDDKNYNVDLTKYAVVNGFDTNNIGERKIQVSYIQGNKIYESDFTINISETPENLIDKEKLGSLIEVNESRDLKNYTRNSSEYFLNALSYAKDVFEKDNATQDEIVTAYKNLTSAISKLVQLVNVAKDKNVEANYNQKDAYKITDNIVNTGNYWASMDGSSNAPIEKSNFIIDLNGDYSIDTIKVFPYWGGSRYYQYDVYVSEDKSSWTKVAEQRSETPCTDQGNTHKLEDVINARYIKVQGVKTYVAGRPDINNFHVIETQVFGEEVKSVIKTHLEIAVEVALEVTEEELSTVVPAVANEFKASLAEAQEILANDEATQEEVNKSFDRLQKVMEMLEFKKGDKEALIALIERINGLNEADYISSTWSKMQAQLTIANNVVSDENAMEAEVSEIYTSLLKSFLQLRLKPSKDKLEELINRAESIDRDKYTEESLESLDNELAYAKEVFLDEEATGEEITKAENGLEVALNSLVEKENNDEKPGNGDNGGNGNNPEEPSNPQKPNNPEEPGKGGKLPSTGAVVSSSLILLLGIGAVVTGVVISRKRKRKE